MPIASKSCLPAGALRNLSGYFWRLPYNNTGATYHLNAGTLNTQIVGGSPAGFASFFTKCVQSLFITPAFSGLTALTLKLTGINQFGETVTENLVFASATAAQTTMCYRQLLTCTIAAMTGTPAAGDTVSIGYSLVNPRLPLLAQLAASQSVLAAFSINQTTLGSQPTVSVTLAPTWAILLTGTLVVGGGASIGDVFVHLNPDDSGL